MRFRCLGWDLLVPDSFGSVFVWPGFLLVPGCFWYGFVWSRVFVGRVFFVVRDLLVWVFVGPGFVVRVFVVVGFCWSRFCRVAGRRAHLPVATRAGNSARTCVDNGQTTKLEKPSMAKFWAPTGHDLLAGGAGARRSPKG